MQKEKLDLKKCIRLAPIVIFTAVTFLFVRVHEYYLPLSQFTYLSAGDDTVLYDFFSYYKMVAVCICAFAAIILMVCFRIFEQRKITFRRLYIPVAGYALCILMSYAFSKYKDFALLGSMERFEGTIVSIAYLVMLVYIVNNIDSIEEVYIILKGLAVTVTLAAILGITQLAGADFFRTNIGTRIIAGKLGATLGFSFGEGLVYQTVYNVDYVGFYLCLVVPALIAWIINSIKLYKESTNNSDGHSKNKRLFYVVAGFIILVLVLLNVYGAKAYGPMPGLIVGSISVLAYYSGGKIISSEKKLLWVILCSATIVSVSVGIIAAKHEFKAADVLDRPALIMTTNGDNIELSVNGITANVLYDRQEEVFRVCDEDGKDYDLAPSEDEPGLYDILYEGLNGVLAFEPFGDEEGVYILLATKDMTWLFEYTDDGVKFVNPVGGLSDLTIAEHANIINNYTMLNGRGYIWDTTLSLVKKHILLGSGADTFMMEFPQDDYVTKYMRGLDIESVTDKPHNMFLQIAVTTGLVSLIFFMWIIVEAVICVVKVLTNPDKIDSKVKASNELMLFALLLGVIAFLIGGIVNDTSVSVMPMFYGLLGTVFAFSRAIYE